MPERMNPWSVPDPQARLILNWIDTHHMVFNSGPTIEFASTKSTKDFVALRINDGGNQFQLYKKLDARDGT